MLHLCTESRMVNVEKRRENTSQIASSGRDPFNQNSDRSDREKRTTSKGGPVFSKLFQLDRTDPLSFGPKFPEILIEWVAPSVCLRSSRSIGHHYLNVWRKNKVAKKSGKRISPLQTKIGDTNLRTVSQST